MVVSLNTSGLVQIPPLRLATGEQQAPKLPVVSWECRFAV